MEFLKRLMELTRIASIFLRLDKPSLCLMSFLIAHARILRTNVPIYPERITTNVSSLLKHIGQLLVCLVGHY